MTDDMELLSNSTEGTRIDVEAAESGHIVTVLRGPHTRVCRHDALASSYPNPDHVLTAQMLF